MDKIGVKREKKDLSFVMANGTIVTRSIGFAIVHVDKYFTIDEFVFAEKGDLVPLGARTLVTGYSSHQGRICPWCGKPGG